MFWECRNGSPYLLQCVRGKLYDATRGLCMEKHLVECKLDREVKDRDDKDEDKDEDKDNWDKDKDNWDKDKDNWDKDKDKGPLHSIGTALSNNEYNIMQSLSIMVTIKLSCC
ncbi:hypothetical protein AVEN_55376-1 [Araneus ventricosus]|uniref:Chitin-binding type-2 domain-containing protein n=1 Tax=Araneus ventricosus TaxID=182803 RepID=A0A4Y2G270_ARAVE|nr:hypothetical protein AVEN_55376-1 [Araneus ventricosus]